MRLKAYLFVFDGLADWEPALALCEINKSGKFDVATVGFSDRTVTTMGGCRVSPSECWHIGYDLKADARGGLSVRLRGVWLNRNGVTHRDGVPMISSLAELKELTDSHSQIARTG